MNYSTHLSLPSLSRVEVSVIDRPELSRLIELPRNAPRQWLAYAYLLSIGVDADMHDLDELEEPARWAYEDWDPEYGPTLAYSPVTQERMRLPGIPGEVQLSRMGDVEPLVGDQQVAVLPADATAAATGSSARWQVSPPPFQPDAVNEELARRYGVVLPTFHASALAGDRWGYGRVPFIDTLLAGLTPLRRIALRAHLDEIGLRDEKGSAEQHDLERAAVPLHRLLAGIGADGIEQDPETGWFPQGFAAELESALGWEEREAADVEPGEVLISVARRAKLVRRLRGRVVPTAAARTFATDPAREIVKALMPVVAGDDRDRYGDRAAIRADTAAAVLAIADGSAQTFDDLMGVVELAATARQRHSHDEYIEEYAWRYPADESARARSVALAVDSVVDGFSVLSAPAAFGEISAGMRAVARAMLL